MVDYLHVVLLEFLQPASQLSLDVAEAGQPYQTAMVSPDKELAAKKIMAEVSGKHHYC